MHLRHALLLAAVAASHPATAQPESWLGFATASGDWLSGGTLTETLDGLISFDYVETDPSGSWIYAPVLAELTWSMSGTHDGCTYTGGPLEFAFGPSDEWGESGGELWIHSDGVYEGELALDHTLLAGQVTVQCPEAEPFHLDGLVTRVFATGFNFFSVRNEGMLLAETYTAFDSGGSTTYDWEMEPVDETAADPSGAAGAGALSAPYPNPTAGAAHVALALERPETLRVEVLDVLGRRVALLHDGPLPAGETTLRLDAALAPGTYLVRATGASLTATQRLTVVR